MIGNGKSARGFVDWKDEPRRLKRFEDQGADALEVSKTGAQMKKNGAKNTGLLEYIAQRLGKSAGAGYAPVGAAPSPKACSVRTCDA